MTSFSSKSENAVDDMIHAETFFARFLVEHNIALSASNHAGELFQNMFTDDKIAKSCASGRTKITQLVRILDPRFQQNLFVFGTDGYEDGG